MANTIPIFDKLSRNDEKNLYFQKKGCQIH